MNDIRAWSYSTGASFKKCKYAFKCYVLDKIKEEGNFFAEDGITKHALAEHYVIGDVTGLPPALVNFKNELNILKNNKRSQVEMDLAITIGFKPTKWNSWNDVWLRSKGDVVVPNRSGSEVVIIDHKFGKRYGSYAEQMEKYFVATAAHFPKAKRFITELWFHKLDVNDEERIDQVIYTLKDLKKSQKKLLKEWKCIKAESEFKPNPSADNCKWCYYAKDKSGNCPYNQSGEL